MFSPGHARRPTAEIARRALVLLAALVLAPRLAGAQAVETGIASWYGPDFHGKRTSNGEIYDKEKLSCAHRTLAFGTYLRVVNLDNGSSVVVRVNDRGPFAKNRVIDLSEAAARIIGMIPTGTARVSLTAIPKEEALAWKGGTLGAEAAPGEAGTDAGADAGMPAASISPGARVRIQVASYASAANANSTVARLAASGLAAAIEDSGGHYRVVFPDLSPEDARLVSMRLDGMGYRGYSVTTITPTR
jgi:rare lipoprotein A